MFGVSECSPVRSSRAPIPASPAARLRPPLVRSTLVALLAAACVACGGGHDGEPVTVDRSPIVMILPDSSTVSVGDTCTVDVAVSGVTDLFSVAFDLTYDPQILEFVSAAEGPFLGKNGADATSFAAALQAGTQGRLDVGITRLGNLPGVSGEGTLCSLTFRALDPGTSALSFDSPRTLLDSMNLPIVDDTWLGANVISDL